MSECLHCGKTLERDTQRFCSQDCRNQYTYYSARGSHTEVYHLYEDCKSLQCKPSQKKKASMNKIRWHGWRLCVECNPFVTRHNTSHGGYKIKEIA